MHTYESWWTDDFGKTIKVPILAIAALENNKEAIDILLKAGASFNELCEIGHDSHSSKYLLKNCDCHFSDEMKIYLRDLGWRGPSLFTLFKGDYLEFRYK